MSCLLAVLAFANLQLAKTRTRPLLGRPRLTPAAATPAGRQAHWPQRGLAGPSPFGSGSLVVWLCIHSTAPAPRCCRCGGWTGQGTLCLRLPAAWPCPAPLTDTRCTHVRAGLLLLLAVVRPTTGSLLPSPPAACSVSTRGAPRVTTDNWVGGWEKLHWLDVATVSAALAVVTLAWGCAAPNRSSEVSSSVLVRCRCARETAARSL